MDRRTFLSLATWPIWLSACSRGGQSDSGNNGSSVDNASAFNQALRIPQELKGELREGVLQYDLTILAAEHVFFEGVSTATYAIDGTFLGPTLRLLQGESVSINYHNKLGEMTTMHGHGMHLPAIMDGGPHQPIAAGGEWSAQYAVNQPASTNWYHPHTHGKTGEQVYKGLAGLILVDDELSVSLNLPNSYGIDDIPLVLQDRRFDSNKQLLYIESNQDIMRGMLGDVQLVNGTVSPYQEVAAGLVRLRVLNGANARVYQLSLSNAQSFQLIASDNGLLAAPITLSSIELSPGERAEIVVDFSATSATSIDLIDNNNNQAELLRFHINQALTVLDTVVPDTLATMPSLDASNVDVTRSFKLTMQGGNSPKFFINGQSMDMARTDFSMNINDIEVWDVENASDMTHNFHMHATHFQILERNGRASDVGIHEKGLKDTVLLKGNERVKLITKMTDFADASAHYMFHCHILEHEDRGMMGQFSVI
jgi:FtsP/CotA-like multicopper oxidase with cupredoxin domain